MDWVFDPRYQTSGDVIIAVVIENGVLQTARGGTMIRPQSEVLAHWVSQCSTQICQ